MNKANLLRETRHRIAERWGLVTLTPHALRGALRRACISALTVVGVLLPIVFQCFAAQSKQENSPSSQSQPANESRNSETTSARSDTEEVRILRRELETVRDYDQRLLNTVLWSLSGVFLLVILLGSYSWFTNFRVYNRDLESIRQQIRADVQQESTALRAAAAQERETFRQRTLEQFEELKASVSEQLGRLSESLRQADKRRATSDSELKEFAKETAKSSATAVQHRLDIFRYNVTDFEARYLRQAGESYRLLDSLVERLQILTDLDWVSHTGHSGSVLREIAQCMRKEGATISYANHEKLLQLLAQMPSSLKADVDSVQGLLDKIGRI